MAKQVIAVQWECTNPEESVKKELAKHPELTSYLAAHFQMSYLKGYFLIENFNNVMKLRSKKKGDFIFAAVYYEDDLKPADP